MLLLLISSCLKRVTCLVKELRISELFISPHFRGGEWQRPRDNKIEKALVLVQQIPGLRLQLQQLWGGLNDLNAIYLLLLCIWSLSMF